MPCFRPLQAYRSLSEKTKNGKSLIEFKRKDAGNLSMPIELPCGSCDGCRMDRARDWALRCYHEASLYEYNCFLTLTYNKESVPDNNNLNKKHLQRFFKKLRKRYNGIDMVYRDGKKTYPIRYFCCGEYGENFDRPHYHVCLFNFDFFDKYEWKKSNGLPLYRSDELEELWSEEINPYDYTRYNLENIFEKKGRFYAKLGYAYIGTMTIESAGYVARYCNKKIGGEKKKSHYAVVDDDGVIISYREQEYVTMSRRPGIAYDWYKKNKGDLYPKDFTTVNGQKYRTARYYDKIHCMDDIENHQSIVKKRLERSKEHAEDNSPRRLCERAKVLKSKLKSLKRSYENVDGRKETVDQFC